MLVEPASAVTATATMPNPANPLLRTLLLVHGNRRAIEPSLILPGLAVGRTTHIQVVAVRSRHLTSTSTRYSPTMEIGVAIGGTIGEVAALAAQAEASGLDSVWVAELDRTALVQAAAAISATSRIGVGTAVALAFPRSPTITAMTAWDLDEMSGDRFMLGLGPQVKRVLEARFSVRVDKPAPQMREYVQAVRTVWAANRGEPVTHEGDAYRIAMPTFHGPLRPDRRDTPILLAAVGPVMSRVCGDVADGLLGHPLASPLFLREAVRPAIDEGLARSGRPSDACPITAMALVSLGDDEVAARRAARLQIAFYATTPSYKAILALHDRSGLPRDLRRAFVSHDLGRMAELIDDELLDAIAIAGRPDEAADRLRAWEGIADRVVLGVPWYGMQADRQREALAAALQFGAAEAETTVKNTRAGIPG
jgi:probable F420-dependent oxidoreductase